MSFFVLVFDTSGIDLSGFSNPQVTLDLTTYILNSSTGDPLDTIIYDPTYDSIDTYPPAGTSTDSDPGRPLSLFGAGLTDTFDFMTWEAANAPLISGGEYSVQPVQAGEGGTPESVLSNVDDVIEARPFAVGQTTQTQMFGGTERIQDGAAITFSVAASDNRINDYLVTEIGNGYLGLVISGLHGATSPIDGSGLGDIYARFATENLFTFPLPELDITIFEGPVLACSEADLTTTGATLPGQAGFGEPDGTADLDDLGYFLGFWLVGDPVGDVTTSGATLSGQPGFGISDGVVDLDDLGYFLTVWLPGCP
ncbi:MAG: GC-type dockerin domain-anchored protein [Planctomycetota bacterium]